MTENLPAVSSPRLPAQIVDVFADADSFAHAQRVAHVYAASALVPQHLRGKHADCLIAYQIARRLNEDPLTVMQNIYMVGGTPGWKTAYLIARVNAGNIFKTRIKWKTEGEGDALKVTAYVTDHDGDYLAKSCDMKMAKSEGWTRNPKYASMPESMLEWRSAAALIRKYCPEIMLGIPTAEELETGREMRNVTPAVAPAMNEMLSALPQFQDQPAPGITQHSDDIIDADGVVIEEGGNPPIDDSAAGAAPSGDQASLFPGSPPHGEASAPPPESTVPQSPEGGADEFSERLAALIAAGADTSEILKVCDEYLAEAAKSGTQALKTAWGKIPAEHQPILEKAKDRRFKPTALKADKEKGGEA